MIEIPSSDPRTWKIAGESIDKLAAFAASIEGLDTEELLKTLREVERKLSLSMKVRRVLRKEIEKRRG